MFSSSGNIFSFLLLRSQFCQFSLEGDRKILNDFKQLQHFVCLKMQPYTYCMLCGCNPCWLENQGQLFFLNEPYFNGTVSIGNESKFWTLIVKVKWALSEIDFHRSRIGIEPQLQLEFLRLISFCFFPSFLRDSL